QSTSQYSCFSNHTATSDIYTLSLHDALPIFSTVCGADFNPPLPLCVQHEVGDHRRHQLALRIVNVARADAHLAARLDDLRGRGEDRKSTRLNSSHRTISYAVFRLKKKKITRK